MEDITCPICLDIYNLPFVLNCGHSFCGHCFYGYQELQGNRCPTCREPFGINGYRRNFAFEACINTCIELKVAVEANNEKVKEYQKKLKEKEKKLKEKEEQLRTCNIELGDCAARIRAQKMALDILEKKEVVVKGEKKRRRSGDDEKKYKKFFEDVKKVIDQADDLSSSSSEDLSSSLSSSDSEVEKLPELNKRIIRKARKRNCLLK